MMNKIIKTLFCLIVVFALPVRVVRANDLDTLADKLAKSKNVPIETARADIERIFDLLSEQLKEGKQIQVRNFGTFYVQKREPREGRNPRTGAKIQIPARSYPKFRSSDNLKELVSVSAAEIASGKLQSE